MRNRSIAAALVFLALTASSVAHADPAQGGRDPEKLFAEGSSLIGQGRCAEALPMLEEAQRLDPGIGTQFNIAVCQEQLGRLGSAWRNFERVAELARASGKKQREEAARAKLEELRPRVPRLVIRSEEPFDVTVKVDGIVVAKDAWAFVPVDPGRHHVDAIAPTKTPWSRDVEAPASAQPTEIVVPKLGVVQETRVVTVEGSNGRRTLGFVLGGIGIAGVAAAAVTGVMLLDAKSTADERCKPKCVDASGRFDQEGADAVSRGETLLPINAVAWGIAIVGLGLGTFFVLTAPRSTTRGALAPSTAFTPTLSPRGRGGALTITF
ncbi:MAG: tetratricopeptide repeat protein [Deltaproteobacteria bacterium]|nr:tetratricopeptide repeat protein [Deltaproteobacteria bacterium]